MKKIKADYKRPLVLVIGDLIIFPLSYIAAYYLRSLFSPLETFGTILPVSFIVLATFCYLFIYYIFGMFDQKRDYFYWRSFIFLFISVLVAGIFSSFLKYIIFLHPIGRGIYFIANLMILSLSSLWRFSSSNLFKYLIKPTNTVIIGTEKPGQDIAEIIHKEKKDFKILGFLNDQKDKIEINLNDTILPFLGFTQQINSLVKEHKIDLVVNSAPIISNPLSSKAILSAQLSGTRVLDISEMYQLIKERVPIDYIQDNWFIKAKGFQRLDNSFLPKFKRFLDATLSSLLLVISLPIWLLIALMIKINSKGPIFYSQQRVGQNESPFSLYKFRSMIEKAEKDKALWADENDKRITATGRILRKLHLDELPQLINVLKGEMSLVGPRPERPEFVEDLEKVIPYYSMRHSVKPGLTGWAQVNYPYASSVEDAKEKLEYDLYYISHMTFLMDIRILIQTLQNVFLGRERHT